MRISHVRSLAALIALSAGGLGIGACTVTNVSSDGGPDSGTSTDDGGGDAGGDASVTPPGNDGGVESGPHAVATSDAAPSPLSFAVANITWPVVDLSMVADEDVSTSCEIRTEVGGADACFTSSAVQFEVTQSDMSKLHVIVVKSLRVEVAGNIVFNEGGLPLAIVSLGDMSILGTINGSNGTLGGATAPPGAQNGGGLGGGAGGTNVGGTPGTGAGGGSYCGLGGQGGKDMLSTVQPGAQTPAYGSASLSPLLPGSSGGTGVSGGASGGGAIELVAGGTFTMNAGSWINVGGGGGGPGGPTGQGANGGGSGGAILIEAVTVNIAGTLAANGGGGGGGNGAENGSAGSDATPNATSASGGVGVAGGNGSGGAANDGIAGTSSPADGSSGAGGGGAGRIRINSMSGAPTLTSATLSPAMGDAGTSCTTVGTL